MALFHVPSAGVRDLWYLYLDGKDSASKALEADENSGDPNRSKIPVAGPLMEGRPSGPKVLRAIPHFNVEKVIQLNGIRSLCTLLLRSLNDPGAPTIEHESDKNSVGGKGPRGIQQRNLEERGALHPVSLEDSTAYQMDRKISTVA